MLEVFFEFTFIYHSFELESALPMTRSFVEITFIRVSSSPTILSMSMRFTVFVATGIYITVAEALLSSAVLKECFKRAYISRSSSMAESSSSLLPIILPLSFITISLRGVPRTPTIFSTHQPLSLKNLAILPLKFSSSMATSIFESPFVNSLPISLVAINFSIISKAALKDLLRSYTYSQTFSFLFLYLSKVNSPIKRYDMKIWSFY